MRQILLSDALHLAAALLTEPTLDRAATLELWLDQTRAAAKYLRRFNRPHPRWGDGSLTARAIFALARARITPTREGDEYLQALAQVALRLARIGQKPRQGLS